jgi:hypothetical protein
LLDSFYQLPRKPLRKSLLFYFLSLFVKTQWKDTRVLSSPFLLLTLGSLARFPSISKWWPFFPGIQFFCSKSELQFMFELVFKLKIVKNEFIDQRLPFCCRDACSSLLFLFQCQCRSMYTWRVTRDTNDSLGWHHGFRGRRRIRVRMKWLHYVVWVSNDLFLVSLASTSLPKKGNPITLSRQESSLAITRRGRSRTRSELIKCLLPLLLCHVCLRSLFLLCRKNDLLPP